MMKKIMAILAVLLFPLMNCFLAESHSAMTWDKELVDYSGMINNSGNPLYTFSLGIYPDNTPVISFRYKPDDRLAMKVKTLLGWEKIAVDESLTNIEDQSLAIGSDGVLHFALGQRNDSSYHRLIYATFDGSFWTLEDIDTSLPSFYPYYPYDTPSIILDSNSSPRICYITRDDSERYIITCRSKETGSWTELLRESSDISTPVTFNHFSALSTGLDSFDFLHILYRSYTYYAWDDPPFDSLQYRHQTAEGWPSVPPGISNAWESKMILDSRNYPHVFYQDNKTAEYVLKHKYQDETGWHEEIVVTQQGGLYLKSVAIDSNDKLHIVYGIWTSEIWDESTSKLIYGYTNNGIWNYSEIDYCRMKGQWDISASLSVDSYGIPHVAYIIPHFTDKDGSYFDKLMYARLTAEEHEITKEHKLQVKKAKKNKGDGIVTSKDGNIICGYTCSYGYYKNIPVTLAATANEGSTFIGWKPDKLNCTGNDPCTVTMDKAKAVQAVFVGDYTLKVVNQSKNGGTGTVTSTPNGISCATGNTSGCEALYGYGEDVTLSALADIGSNFLGWKPAKLCPGIDDCIVSVDKKRTIKAIFSRE